MPEMGERAWPRSDYQRPSSQRLDRRLDDIFLHKLWGPLIFMLVVGAVFQTVFGLGQPMSTAFQDLLTKAGAASGALCFR